MLVKWNRGKKELKSPTPCTLPPREGMEGKGTAWLRSCGTSTPTPPEKAPPRKGG